MIIEQVSINPNDIVLAKLSAPQLSYYKTGIWPKLRFSSIWYKSDQRNVKGFLVQHDNNEKLPALIFNRGGSKESGMISPQYLITYLARLAEHLGVNIIASQYSGNDGSDGKDELGGMDVNDVLNLKQVIDELPNYDSEQIYMHGVSRGGLMTYLSLKAHPDWLKKASVACGEADLSTHYTLRPDLKSFRSDMYSVDLEVENKKRSVVYWVDKLPKNIPLLIIHGTNDQHVPFEEAERLRSKLEDCSIPHKFVSYEDDHFFSNNQDNIFDDLKEWYS